MTDIGVGLDSLATGGVTGMLVAVMIAFLRRTRDADDRLDQNTKLVMDVAWGERDKAYAERDKAYAERDLARSEAERLRLELTRRHPEED